MNILFTQLIMSRIRISVYYFKAYTRFCCIFFSFPVLLLFLSILCPNNSLCSPCIYPSHYSFAIWRLFIYRHKPYFSYYPNFIFVLFFLSLFLNAESQIFPLLRFGAHARFLGWMFSVLSIKL